METFPRAFASIIEAGHEIAAHGCFHEAVPKLDNHDERRLMARQIEQHIANVGVRPRGYRSPAWDFTDETMALLEEFGFEWDSSLMGRDFEPYRPRPVEVRWEEGSVFGPPSSLLEIPVSWYLDDWPAVEFVPGVSAGLGDTTTILNRWRDHFDYAYANVPNPVYVLTVHPQTIGRAHHIMMFEKLIEHMSAHEGVWFATLSEIYDCWVDA
jgi:peptidoglycan/xylan/chitin deacetylase (PgdA/CDA1 family)